MEPVVRWAARAASGRKADIQRGFERRAYDGECAGVVRSTAILPAVARAADRRRQRRRVQLRPPILLLCLPRPAALTIPSRKLTTYQMTKTAARKQTTWNYRPTVCPSTTATKTISIRRRPVKDSTVSAASPMMIQSAVGLYRLWQSADPYTICRAANAVRRSGRGSPTVAKAAPQDRKNHRLRTRRKNPTKRPPVRQGCRKTKTREPSDTATPQHRREAGYDRSTTVAWQKTETTIATAVNSAPLTNKAMLQQL